MWHVIGVLVGVAICSPARGCGQGPDPAASCASHPILSALDAVTQPTFQVIDAGLYAVDFGQVNVGTWQGLDLAVANDGFCPSQVLSITMPSDAEFAFPNSVSSAVAAIAQHGRAS